VRSVEHLQRGVRGEGAAGPEESRVASARSLKGGVGSFGTGTSGYGLVEVLFGPRGDPARFVVFCVVRESFVEEEGARERGGRAGSPSIVDIGFLGDARSIRVG
jgi:hypothetical protein